MSEPTTTVIPMALTITSEVEVIKAADVEANEESP